MGDNYYKILKIPYSAETGDISKAYRKLAAIYHPDNKQTGNAEHFVQISNAYSILSNPESKLSYDVSISDRVESKVATKSKSASNEDNLDDRLDYIKTRLHDLLNNSRKVRRRTTTTRSNSEKPFEIHRLKISYAESITGSLRYIYTKKQYLCDACSGKGGRSRFDRCVQCGGVGIVGSKVAVYIKPYTQQNEIFSINGINVKVQVIIVNKHHYFTDSQNRVIMKVPIKLSESIEGCNIEVLSPNLNLLKINVPPKIHSGALLKIMNKREKDIDFYIKVYIQTPNVKMPIELQALKEVESQLYDDAIRTDLKKL
jgi:DnaJ-class molecular chaperone